ncbi:DUF6358 family protein [Parapedobacter sp.]
MKRYFFYNVMLNIGLILMSFATIAAYSSDDNGSKYLILAISVAILLVLAYLKYRLLKLVRQFTQEKNK